MTNKKIKNALIGTTIGLASLIGATNQARSDPLEFPAIDARAGSEYTGNSDGFKIKSTIGVAPKGSYDQGTISTRGQFFEFFRAYNVIEKNKTETLQYTAAGIRLPSFKVEGLENKVILFGSQGDRQGVGIESRHIIDKLMVTLNAENSDEPVDANRLGLGINYQLTPTISIGAGFDNVRTIDGDTNQYLLNSVIDLSKNDAIGLALVIKDNSNSTRDNSLGAFWIHYNDSLGVRSRIKYDWNEENDSQSLGGQIIFAENPTTGKPGATWLLGRNAGDDEMYNQSLIPLSVSQTEAVSAQDRATSGLTLILEGLNGKVRSSEFGYLQGEVGYTFHAPIAEGKLGVSGGTRYDWNENGSSTKIIPSLIYRVGHLDIKAGVSIPVSGENQKPVYTIGGQINF